MTFDQLTHDEAEAYRARVEADGPARLTALAEALAADGVSLEEFDGTPRSLVPLWHWFVGFARADFPGVGGNVIPRSYSIEPWGAELARLHFASEMIEDYLVEVAAVCFADVSWVVNPDVGAERFQRPTVQYWDTDGARHFAEPSRHVSGAVKRAIAGALDANLDEYLADRFFRGPFLALPATAQRCRNLPRRESILAPLLDRTGIDHLPYQRMRTSESVYARTAVPTLEVMKQQKAVADAEPAGDELVLAHASANMEALDEALAIDAVVISDTLNTLGFRSRSGEPITAASILTEASTEYLLDDDAIATTLVFGGELRAVQLASLNTTEKTWTKLIVAFTKAGRPMGAKLAREDEFMPDDDA